MKKNRICMVMIVVILLIMGHPELGTLSVGSCADIAVISKIDGDFDECSDNGG